MVLIRLSSFTFMLMFTLLEARDSIFKHQPLYHQGVLKAKITKNEIIEAKGIYQTIAAKEIKSIPFIPEEEGNKMMLNGRKLASKDEFKKEKANTKELAKMPMDRRSSKISGRNINPSRMQSSEPKPEDKKTKEVTDQEICNARKRKGEKRVGITNESFQKLKKSHDLEATNEQWTTLMNKDYPGNGGGRRNPPTNNR